MKAHTLWTKAAAGLGTVALTLALGCSHTTMAQNAGQQTGELRTEQAAQQNDTTTGNTLGTAPAPANTQNATNNPGTPAVISGPAAVDSTGRVYTSSSVGAAGNASSTGLNTNVNIVPKNNQGSVTVATSQAPAPVVTTETTTQTTEVTPTPAPAPIVTETPAPAPAPVVETPAPMTSSTTEQTTTTESTTTTTTKHHRRMRKD